jgi:hypothetical protein
MKKQKEEKSQFDGKQIAELLKLNPEIEVKVEYGKSIIIAKDELVSAIEAKILTEKDAYKKAKFKVEHSEITRDIYYHQKFFEHWLLRCKDYEIRYAEITADYAANYEQTVKRAKEITSNLRLVSVIDGFESQKNPSEETKVQFFLYCKQEIENFNKLGKLSAKK